MPSGHKQQFKFRFPSSLDRGHRLSLIAPVSRELPIDVPVAGFQFPYQRAFGHLSMPEQPVRTDLVGKAAYQQLSKPQHYPKNTVFYSVNHSVIG